MADELKPLCVPRKGDVLFRDDLPDGFNNVRLNSALGDDQLAYTEGYRRGAQFLVEYVTAAHQDQDFLVYPIIFLYRHHIELVVKRLIGRAPYLIERPLTDLEKKHWRQPDLDLLWQDFKPMFATICKSAGWKIDPEAIDGIDDYIRQIVELDPDSYGFRYAHSAKADPSLPPHLQQINLCHFAGMMERLASYLDSIDAATDHFEKVKAKMEAGSIIEMTSYTEWT
jgi:hypothetical protein